VPWIVVLALFLASCGGSDSSDDDEAEAPDGNVTTAITVTSPAFDEEAPIPEKFSCAGENVSPELSWDGVPVDAAEVALVVDDPDAPSGSFVHWVVFGLDPSVTALAEGEVPAGAKQAKNGAGDASYAGPCPPEGDDAHRYRFTVYALGEAVDGETGVATDEVLDAIAESAVAKGTLTGVFDR